MIIKKVAKKVYRLITNKPHQWCNRILHKLETRPLSDGEDDFPFSPIFIIGPPRSGSTLLFQVMVNVFDLNYTTNADAFWYGGLSLRKRFAPIPRSKKKTDFSSSHGKTRGRFAPNECGEYWYQFFRRKPQYVSLGEENDGKMKRLRCSLLRIAEAGGVPMLFKNMNCALRLGPIYQACPGALYIVTHRELLWNSHSLLQVRNKVYGDYSKWWSMEPKEIDDLEKLPPEKQVVEQVRAIHREIDQQRTQAGVAHFFDVDYEELCNDPKRVMKSMNDFFEQHGMQILSSLDNVPDSFPLSEKCRVEVSLFDRLRNYVRAEV